MIQFLLHGTAQTGNPLLITCLAGKVLCLKKNPTRIEWRDTTKHSIVRIYSFIVIKETAKIRTEGRPFIQGKDHFVAEKGRELRMWLSYIGLVSSGGKFPAFHCELQTLLLRAPEWDGTYNFRRLNRRRKKNYIAIDQRDERTWANTKRFTTRMKDRLG